MRIGAAALAALVSAAAAVASLPADAATAVPSGPVVMAYLFPRERTLDPQEIAAEKLTHVIYAFANISAGRVVEGSPRDAENFRALRVVRAKHPHLALLVAVGGWTWSGGFSDAAFTPESRRVFVESAVDFVARHDLDGFDVDWEYPGLPGNGNTHRPEDKQNFTALMSELRAALDASGRARGRRHVLSFAAGAFPNFLAHTEMAKVQGVVDFVNLMTYDFRVPGADPLAGHHANLFLHPDDPKQNSADGAVKAFLEAGVPAGKLVFGVPFYGRAWADVDGDATTGGLYRPGVPPRERLETRYDSLAASLVDRAGFARRWDDRAQAPFLWNAERRVFVSYDDPESLRRKSRYIREHGLAGVMFWEYFADRSGALLDTLFRELRGDGAAGERQGRR